MKKAEKTNFKRVIVIFTAFILICLIMITLLFVEYRRRVTALFDTMVEHNLQSHADAQRIEVRAAIRDVQGTLEAIAAIYNTTSLDPDSEWTKSFLAALSSGQHKYSAEYIPIETLIEGASSETELETLRRLEAGETIISDLRLSKRLGNRYFFSIAVPVRSSGKLTGVLRSIQEGTQLTEISDAKKFFNALPTYLVQPDGTVMIMDGENIGQTPNLIQQLKEKSLPADRIDKISSALKNETDLIVPIGRENGHTLFLSVVSLGYNGWNLLSFANAGELSDYPKAVLIYTIVLGIILAGIIFIFGLASLKLYLHQRRRLHREQSKYDLLARFSDTILFDYDYGTDMLEFTPNICTHFLIDDPKIQNPAEALSIKKIVHPADRKRFIDIFSRPAAENINETLSEELRFKGIDTQYHWLLLQYQTVQLEKGILSTVGKMIDISAQKNKEEDLLQKSSIDATTGILNKITMERKLRKTLSEETQGFLFMLDLDNFKTVNDQLGHPAGDRLLAQIGLILREIFRRGDLIGRIGGDEFMVFMENTCEQSAACAKADKLCQRIAAIPLDKGIRVTASIGIVQFPNDAKCYETLYNAADKAMYKAKHSGKNNYCFYSDITL